MTRRHLYPCPLDPILDHPDFIALPAAGAGMLFRLCAHAWQTQMRPLPRADHELRGISRAHFNTWNAHKADILRVFEAWRPVADAYYQGREAKSATLAIAASRGGMAAARRRRATALEESLTTPDPASFHQMGVYPRREPSQALTRPVNDRPPRKLMTDRTRQ